MAAPVITGEPHCLSVLEPTLPLYSLLSLMKAHPEHIIGGNQTIQSIERSVAVLPNLSLIRILLLNRGTGLGYMITKNIVHNHGGSIDVKSSPERGTSFTIQLPVL